MNMEPTPSWLNGPDVPPPARVGTVLCGIYRLDSFIGRGSTGVTYGAWHLDRRTPCAVKLLHRPLRVSPERVARFREDQRILERLARLGFVPMELGLAPDGAPFLVSELLFGETLRQRLLRGSLAAPTAGAIITAIARALHEAHLAGVRHGDLRPENIFLPSAPTRNAVAGQPLLVDGALHHLRLLPGRMEDELPLSHLAYMAPEQTLERGAEPDSAADIFALGAILYECLAGQAAFAGPDRTAVLKRLKEPPPRLTTPKEMGVPPELLVGLDVVIAGACAYQKEARIPTLERFVAAMRQCYAGAGVELPTLCSVSDADMEQVRAALRQGSGTPRPASAGPPAAKASGAHPPLSSGSHPAKASASHARPPPIPLDASVGRVPKGTLRARDLSRLRADTQAGQRTVHQAGAMAAGGEMRPELTPPPPAGAEPPAAPATDQERLEAERATPSRGGSGQAERLVQTETQARTLLPPAEEAEQAGQEADREEPRRAGEMHRAAALAREARPRTDGCPQQERGAAGHAVQKAETPQGEVAARHQEARSEPEQPREMAQHPPQPAEQGRQAATEATTLLAQETTRAAQTAQQIAMLHQAASVAPGAQLRPQAPLEPAPPPPSRPAMALPVIDVHQTTQAGPRQSASHLTVGSEQAPPSASDTIFPPPVMSAAGAADVRVPLSGGGGGPAAAAGGLLTLWQTLVLVIVTGVLSGAVGALSVLILQREARLPHGPTAAASPSVPPPAEPSPPPAAEPRVHPEPAQPGQSTPPPQPDRAPAATAEPAPPAASSTGSPEGVPVLPPERLAARRADTSIPPLRGPLEQPVPPPAPSVRPVGRPPVAAAPPAGAPAPVPVLDGELRDPYQ
ncbi:MAG: hypothetical protein RMK29_17175 [Myxococcales bacterium]|nr:hypothetical protein [Myxococcota bacterium]MDW8283442.1 hypothetical protein [Myxococcales bacterium]